MAGEFIETPRFPEVFSRGARIGPGFVTRVIGLDSGAESRNPKRSRDLVEMEISKNLLEDADYATLLAWFRIAKGRWRAFRVKDWSDYLTTHSNGGLVGRHGDVETGDWATGWGTPTYRITKGYPVGSETAVRLLKKPVSGTVVVKRDAATVTEGAGAGQIDIDEATGIVTFVADAAQNVNSVTVGATTQVTLAAALAGLAIGGRLWLQGLAGADAALLNDLSHAITNIAGAVYTLATDTAGKTITAGAGVGRKYPQPTEALTVACEFDVPMRFDIDRMDATLDAFNLHSWPQIPLREEPYP